MLSDLPNKSLIDYSLPGMALRLVTQSMLRRFSSSPKLPVKDIAKEVQHLSRENEQLRKTYTEVNVRARQVSP
ncbi:hypothetical protein MKW98_019686 [Papaver atlanticum]|uniref:Uncharacterized protein n=1 Tax=Papaver atlanticum TaxID=357466 RepID=A0AAD4S906_9MAGN|nr:hypothetical protein MKW98_019686 [Papaver atlanticum]